MRRSLAIAAAAALALALAACGQQTGTATTGGAGVGGSSTPAGVAAEDSPSDSSPAAPSASTLGASVKYPDGLVVATSKPARFKPTEYAAGPKPGVPSITIGLTVTNGTKKVVDAVSFSATLTYGANGENADTITDTDKHVVCSFSQKILPGKKASTLCGFSVPSTGLSKLQFQVSAGFDRDSAVFTGAL